MTGDRMRDDRNERRVGRGIVGGAGSSVMGGGPQSHRVDVAKVKGLHLGCRIGVEEKKHNKVLHKGQ